MNGIRANARKRLEQNADLALKNLNSKKLKRPCDEVLLTSNGRYKHYKANEDRMILKDGLLFQKYYGETDSVKGYQIYKPN